MSTHVDTAIPIDLIPQLLDMVSASFKSLGKSTAKDGGIDFHAAENCRDLATNCPPAGALNPKMLRLQQDILEAKELGARWSAFLRLHYPMMHADKHIAQDFACAPRTARSWLSGQEPRVGAIARAGELFGMSAAVRLLFPEFQEVTSIHLFDRIDAMMTQLSTLRQGFVEEQCGQPLHGGRHS